QSGSFQKLMSLAFHGDRFAGMVRRLKLAVGQSKRSGDSPSPIRACLSQPNHRLQTSNRVKITVVRTRKQLHFAQKNRHFAIVETSARLL
ncbi:MAG TPA: hypothetical protein VN765_15420, partial [Candidatus Acidoferrum sp.]|nr:hypothetical protein [Candidatus Acidoferrum sp.]